MEYKKKLQSGSKKILATLSNKTLSLKCVPRFQVTYHESKEDLGSGCSGKSLKSPGQEKVSRKDPGLGLTGISLKEGSSFNRNKAPGFLGMNVTVLE